MQVSEYIANQLANLGVRHIFMVTGGGSMFLNYVLDFMPYVETLADIIQTGDTPLTIGVRHMKSGAKSCILKQ